MTKKLLLAMSVTMSLLILGFGGWKWRNVKENKILHYNNTINQVEPMPIVTDDPFAHLAHGGAPIEQRDEKYRRWLATGLKIQVTNASGSGTIVFYDTRDGWAYVQSCGHLWNGNMTAEEGKTRKLTCKVITWYHNEKKLSGTRDYPAEVIYYSNTRGYDVSLLRFKPDWEPTYIPIAPSDFQYKEGARYHSVGCDGGREVAHYDVRFIGKREADIVTTENSPRPGRSGGGLMTDDLYIGICWGTTDTAGNGNGLFTPLSVLRDYNQRAGYGWLNDAGVNWARRIPIINRNRPQTTFPPDYIPLPQGR